MLHISEHPAERLLTREGRLFDARRKVNIQIGKDSQEKNGLRDEFVTEASEILDRMNIIISM